MADGVVSGCVVVLVDESTADALSFDLVASPDRDLVGGVVGCTLVDPAMGAVLVVAVDVLDNHASELPLVPDDGAVKQFVTQGTDPSFGVRVRSGRPRQDPNCGDPRSGEDVVE